MKYIEIGKVYRLKSGEKCILVGCSYEVNILLEYQALKPILICEVKLEDGTVHYVYESALEEVIE